MTTTTEPGGLAAYREELWQEFLSLTTAEVNILAGMLAKRLADRDPHVLAAMLGEAKAVAS